MASANVLSELLAKTVQRKAASETLSERDKYRGLGSKGFWDDTYKAKGVRAMCTHLAHVVWCHSFSLLLLTSSLSRD